MLKVFLELKVTVVESIKVIQEREHWQTKVRIIVMLVTLDWDTVFRQKLAFFTLFLLDSSFHSISDFFKLVKNIVMYLMNWILSNLMLLFLATFRQENIVQLSAHLKLYLIKVDLGKFNVPFALFLDLLSGLLILGLIIVFAQSSLILFLKVF